MSQRERERESEHCSQWGQGCKDYLMDSAAPLSVTQSASHGSAREWYLHVGAVSLPKLDLHRRSGGRPVSSSAPHLFYPSDLVVCLTVVLVRSCGCRQFMVAVPAVIEAGRESRLCVSLLQPNETLAMTVALDFNDKKTVLFEKSSDTEFHQCAVFQVLRSACLDHPFSA